MLQHIGRTLAMIGILHTIVGFVKFAGPVGDIIGDGGFDAVRSDPERGLAMWFLYAGVVLVMLGFVVDRLEGVDPPVPRTLGWGMLAATTLGVFLCPLSGFWLLFVPAIGVLRASRTGSS